MRGTSITGLAACALGLALAACGAPQRTVQVADSALAPARTTVITTAKAALTFKAGDLVVAVTPLQVSGDEGGVASASVTVKSTGSAQACALPDIVDVTRAGGMTPGVAYRVATVPHDVNQAPPAYKVTMILTDHAGNKTRLTGCGTRSGPRLEIELTDTRRD